MTDEIMSLYKLWCEKATDDADLQTELKTSRAITTLYSTAFTEISNSARADSAALSAQAATA